MERTRVRGIQVCRCLDCAFWPSVPCALIYGKTYLPVIIYTLIYYNMNIIYTSIKSHGHEPGEAERTQQTQQKESMSPPSNSLVNGARGTLYLAIRRAVRPDAGTGRESSSTSSGTVV